VTTAVLRERESAEAQQKRPAEDVPDLRVTLYNATGPVSATTIPGEVLQLASKVIPGQVSTALGHTGLSLDTLSDFASHSELRGVILEHEDCSHNAKVVIAFGDTQDQESTLDTVMSLKIRVFKSAERAAVSTTTIPGHVLHAAEALLPLSAKTALKAGDVPWEDIASFARENRTKGVTLLRHEDLENGDRVVLSLE